MIYVYAFCPTPNESLSLPKGIAHPEVELVAVEKLGAIAESDVDVSYVKEDDAQLMSAVLAHDHVLGHLFGQTVLLPLRFGTQFTNEASLETFLRSHQDAYRQQLDKLRNKAEYLLKLTPKPMETPAPAADLTGREYFLAKKQRLQAQSEVQQQRDAEYQRLLAQLDASHVPFVQSARHGDEERLHVLLNRDGAIAQETVTAWQQQLPTWQVACSEPLPPYHFAA